MARRKPKFNYSIICDDIRHEVGNKLSFIGVYGKDIIIPKVPANLPLLCVAISYKNLRAGDFFSIKAIDVSGKKLGQLTTGSVPKNAKGYIDFTILAKFANIKIEKEGTIKLNVRFNDDESTENLIEIPIKARQQ